MRSKKSVKQSLLEELYADLHWDSSEPEVRLKAVISKSVQVMTEDISSPFFHRIMAAEDRSDPRRCISLTTLFKALDHPELYIPHVRRGKLPVFGALYAGDNSDVTLRRTCVIVNHWFGNIRDASPEWWDLGRSEGGGLSMNDSVAAQMQVLRSVLSYLSERNLPLYQLDDKKLVEILAPFSNIVSGYLASLNVEERKRYRDLRGSQGQITRARRSQLAILKLYPEYEFSELKKFNDEESLNTNTEPGQYIREIESMLQSFVLEELRREYGVDEQQWWMQGVPKNTRLKATRIYEDDDGKRGGREYYLDLIDYREIVTENWLLLGASLGREGASASKANKTK